MGYTREGYAASSAFISDLMYFTGRSRIDGTVCLCLTFKKQGINLLSDFLRLLHRNQPGELCDVLPRYKYL